MKTVHHIRKTLGLSQVGLAERLGVCQSSVSAYERGAQEISPAIARKLVAVSVQHGQPFTLDQIYGLAELPGSKREELAAQV